MLSSYLTDNRRELWRSGAVTVYRVRSSGGACSVLRILASGSPREAFLRETTLLRELTHPHIVSLLEAGEAEGTLYQVHRDIDATLEQRLHGSGRLGISETVGIARPVAEALAYLHSRGLVHCNVTPRAVWFLSGQPILSQFELATAAGTLVTAPRGTPAYMSPEQARPGERIDARMDIYSLGVLLFEMLAGPSPSRRRLRSHRVGSEPDRSMRSLQEAAPPVPEALQAAVRQATAEAPHDRFATMELFLGALAAA